MKEVGDLKSLFIMYISNISVKIKDVMVEQRYFILEKGLNSCIFN